MENGEVVDLCAYRKNKKIEKLNNVSGKKRIFLNWFNELPLETRKRAEKIGMKRLEIIKNFGNKFYFPQAVIKKAEIELGEKTEEELLEIIKQADLNNVQQEEATRLSITVKKIIYQEDINEE